MAVKLLSALFILCTLFSLILASCDCDDADRECVTQCVLDAEDCIIGCGDDTQCYESCITDKWPHANDLIEEEVYSGNNDLPAFGSDGIPIQSNPGFGTESPLPYSPSTTRYGSPTTNTATTTASGTANPSNASAASSLRSSVNALVSLLAAFGIAMWLFRTN